MKRGDAPFDEGSEAALSVAPEATGLPVPPDAGRYDEVRELGMGGVGRVVLVHDRHLRRDVARKQGVTHGAARLLLREAHITARLEHPGIVPIYDLAWSPEQGTTFTMRVVRGRSLAEVLAAASVDGRGPSLVRKLLTAVEAVAHAHAQGVVHRDLKPHNIMLGDHGEVQVIDWGLAQVPPAWLADGQDAGAHEATGPVGTPRYMSPEQARGEPIDARADVWSLGAILYELVTGRPAIAGHAGAEVRARVAAGPRVEVAGTTSPELAAIIERAMAPRAADRYGDASALADDLARYLDGRRVNAHSYSTWALFRRLVRAWRVPLAIAGVASIAVVATVVGAFVRVSHEEQHAQRNLALALVGAAEQHAARDERPEAESLAAHALTRFSIDDDGAGAARARGVLARFGASARPGRTPLASFGCADPDIAGDLVLCRDAEHLAVHELRSGAVRWQRSWVQRAARFFDGGRNIAAIGTLGELTVIASDTGEFVSRLSNARCLVRFAPHNASAAFLAFSTTCLARFDARGTTEGRVPCAPGVGFHAAALSDDGRRFFVLCDDGHLVAGDPAVADGALDAVATPLVAPQIEANVLVPVAGGLLVGTTAGAVIELAYDGSVGRRVLDPTLGMVRTIVASPDARRLVVMGDRAAPHVLDRTTLSWLVRLPTVGIEAVAFDAAGALQTMATASEHWDLDRVQPVAHDVGSGVSGLWLSPDGDTLAVAHGDSVSFLTRDLAPRAHVRWQRGTVKAGAFAAGRFYAQGVGDRQVVELDATGVTTRFDATELRRLVTLADGALVAADFGHGIFVRAPGEAVFSRVLDVALIDLVASADGLVAVGLGEADRSVYALTPGPTLGLRWITTDPRASALALTARGDTVIAAHGDRLVAYDVASGRMLAQYPSPVEVVALAVSPDGAWLAAGGANGNVQVWRRESAQPVASIGLHERRVGALRFDGDADHASTRLYSGGWDGRVQILDIASLTRAPGPLSSELDAAWGLSLRELLGEGEDAASARPSGMGPTPD